MWPQVVMPYEQPCTSALVILMFNSEAMHNKDVAAGGDAI